MPKRKIKVRAVLDAIPAALHQVSLRKWWHLLGLLRSITLAVSGAKGTFTRLQHTLHQARGIWVQLSSTVHNELSAWHQIFQELAAWPTHLQDLDPFPLTWEGATDASGTGMGGAYQTPDGQ